ncbi:MAG: hypothetical protein GF418_07370 [Chitinivibrionales bacterium]|nr:hypothetical protein [Chitinivibrionales bacterium]MBD3395431.1 hypothetical protein [Chitinivibrionales bacterium]
MSLFSIWLIPCEQDSRRLRQMIEALSRPHGAVPFDPHVTVISGETGDPDAVHALVKRVASRTSPFVLDVGGISCTESFFKSVFLTFEQSAALNRLHGSLRSRIEEHPGYRFFPHLSLLYCDMPLEDKRWLAGTVDAGMGPIRFSGLRTTTPGTEQGWRDVAAWRVVGTARLSA